MALSHESAVAYHNRANAWAGLGRLDEAMADFEKAIRLAPSMARAYCNRFTVVAKFMALIELVTGILSRGTVNERPTRVVS